MVKYLKGWGDHKRNKMPSGLAMTILAAENTKHNERDDIRIEGYFDCNPRYPRR